MKHPLPYGFAKAQQMLLEDDGRERVLWATDSTAPSALGEVLANLGFYSHCGRVDLDVGVDQF